MGFEVGTMAESESEGSEFWKIGECTIQRPTRQRNLPRKHSREEHGYLPPTPAP